jgi:hypothetical protein
MSSLEHLQMVSISPPQAPKRFYFLEYFYVLLKSVNSSSNYSKIFEQFISLKQEYQLGESRYKKLTSDSDSTHTLVRFNYTFEQVLSEAEGYKLVLIIEDSIRLTKLGIDLIKLFEENRMIEYRRLLFELMESRYKAFRYIVETCYKANAERSGLLIFPIYSAYRLGYTRDLLHTSGDIKKYFEALKIRLEHDIDKYLGKSVKLDNENNILLHSLVNAGILSEDDKEPFPDMKHNVIMKRSRDYWLKYFLQELYGYAIPLNTFELWAYRGKQIGILHITEFYPEPDFNGRVVYPLSIVKNNVLTDSFKKIYDYGDGTQMYTHCPSWGDGEEFVESLFRAYIETRRTSGNYFVSLPTVRERVCYAMKIPEYMFDDYLGRAYRLRDELKIKISLEVDKLPVETNLTYIHREPVMVEGKYRNIIAIDLV